MFHSDRAATGPCFVPGLPHVVAHSSLQAPRRGNEDTPWDNEWGDAERRACGCNGLWAASKSQSPRPMTMKNDLERSSPIALRVTTELARKMNNNNNDGYSSTAVLEYWHNYACHVVVCGAPRGPLQPSRSCILLYLDSEKFAASTAAASTAAG